MNKINFEIADELQFEAGDSCVVIKKNGSISKIIVPKMDTETLNSDGYRTLLDIIDILQPGSKEEFIKHNEKHKGSIH